MTSELWIVGTLVPKRYGAKYSLSVQWYCVTQWIKKTLMYDNCISKEAEGKRSFLEPVGTFFLECEGSHSILFSYTVNA